MRFVQTEQERNPRRVKRKVRETIPKDWFDGLDYQNASNWSEMLLCEDKALGLNIAVVSPSPYGHEHRRETLQCTSNDDARKPNPMLQKMTEICSAKISFKPLEPIESPHWVENRRLVFNFIMASLYDPTLEIASTPNW